MEERDILTSIYEPHNRRQSVKVSNRHAEHMSLKGRRKNLG